MSAISFIRIWTYINIVAQYYGKPCNKKLKYRYIQFGECFLLLYVKISVFFCLVTVYAFMVYMICRSNWLCSLHRYNKKCNKQ